MDHCFVKTPSKKQKAAYTLKHPLRASGDALQSAMNTGKTWRGKAKVAFINGTKEQQDFVRKTLAEEFKDVEMPFVWVESLSEADIRVYFGGGSSWSYLGSDATRISGVTLALGWLDVGVVCHEFGHASGLQHEHQHPERDWEYEEATVYDKYSKPPNSWDRQTIYHNLIRTLSDVMGTYDRKSCMHYRVENSLVKPQYRTSGTYLVAENDRPSPGDIEILQDVYGPASDDRCDRLKERDQSLRKRINALRRRRYRVRKNLRKRGC